MTYGGGLVGGNGERVRDRWKMYAPETKMVDWLGRVIWKLGTFVAGNVKLFVLCIALTKTWNSLSV